MHKYCPAKCNGAKQLTWPEIRRRKHQNRPRKEIHFYLFPIATKSFPWQLPDNPGCQGRPNSDPVKTSVYFCVFSDDFDMFF